MRTPIRVSRIPRALGPTVAAAVSLAALGNAGAFEVNPTPNLRIRWDNTVKYTTGVRVTKQSPALIAPINGDDGDRSFDPGIISLRFDLLSEIDATYRDLGVRVSGAGWYDIMYNIKNDNDSPGTFNAYTVPVNEFTNPTRDLHGRYVELLDALLFANGTLGNMPANVRVGRHTLLWGETLLIADNGIFYGQAPLDTIKALSIPGLQAKELFMPVGQVSGQLRPINNLILAAFYQFEYRRTRLPAAGSYFSSTDILEVGGERLFAGPPGAALFRGNDLVGSNSGQWGVSVRYRVEKIDTDFGVYFLNFHDKLPAIYLYPGMNADPAVGKVGEYSLVFPEDVKAIGASFATGFESFSWAGEVHFRQNMPLASTPQTVMPGVTADNDENPLYAVGNTAHALTSGIYTAGPSPVWGSATILAEIGWQCRMAFTKNEGAFVPGRGRQAFGVRALFSPNYFQALPNLDVSLPFSLTYNPVGNGPLAGFNGGANNGGIASAGVSGEYRKLWIANLQFSFFFGAEDYQMRRDRSFVSLSLQRTF